jgi:glycerone phosphate O-acyltransferase/fatty acyl-CoA reductase
MALKDNNLIEFFIEGRRSTYGKILQPKFDLLNIICEALFERRVEDITIIPVSFSYDRVMEADSFPYELIGEKRVKESFARIIKTV